MPCWQRWRAKGDRVVVRMFADDCLVDVIAT
jgi:hypothetical protein